MDGGRNRYFFPLTSLQIGDMQSYLSELTIFLVPESNKLLILVDNRPWLTDHDSRPAHLWQLMVTKSRLSPFANTKTKPKTKGSGRIHLSSASKSNLKKSKKFYRWFSLIDGMLYQKTTLLPVKKLKDSFLLNNDLQHILYGYIVFEVSLDQIRGINYLNELQTDTLMALEAKLMKRWEFDSIKQASKCASSWFSGTSFERHLFQEYLNSVLGEGELFYDAQESTSANTYAGSDCSVSSFRTPPPTSGSYKRRKIMKSNSSGDENDESSTEAYSEIISSATHSVATTSSGCDSETADVTLEPNYYKDILILFRFNDPDLPFELKKTIVSDLRLLTLLEYGLPSWVIFLQSYPVFCRLYRPWMCSLARVLYVVVSVVTVLIGFYDLYKNVPVLKATASRLCGPYFEWIESWEMISRVKYLGTMLFLHHFEKSVAWFVMIAHAIKSTLSVITKPMVGPVLELVDLLVPVRDICLESLVSLSSFIFSVAGSTCSTVMSFLQIIYFPLWTILSTAWSIAASVLYPLFWIFGEILVAPIHLVHASANSVLLACSYIYHIISAAWSSVGSMLKIASTAELTVEASDVSMWRALWNDLFSQVLHAIRSILYGFIAFCAACNRHRMSIYNHLEEFFLRTSYGTSRSRPAESSSHLRKTRAPTLAERKAYPPGKVSPVGKHPKHYKKKLA